MAMVSGRLAQLAAAIAAEPPDVEGGSRDRAGHGGLASGFCAGVVRAIETVERALALFPAPVYVRRAIVHNAHVVARLAAAGAIFVDELDEVPIGSVVVLSAHGVAPSVHEQARARGLRVIDATCPLVAKVHHEVRRSATPDSTCS